MLILQYCVLFRRVITHGTVFIYIFKYVCLILLTNVCQDGIYLVFSMILSLLSILADMEKYFEGLRF